MSYIPDSLRSLVRERAGERCEYCLIHEDDLFTFHEIDHIFAEKHDGETHEDNLCLSCFQCNRYKGTDLTSIDPYTREITALYHPRKDSWDEHFRIDDGHIIGLTARGRVTVRLLRFNDPDRTILRQSLIAIKRYP